MHAASDIQYSSVNETPFSQQIMPNLQHYHCVVFKASIDSGRAARIWLVGSLA